MQVEVESRFFASGYSRHYPTKHWRRCPLVFLAWYAVVNMDQPGTPVDYQNVLPSAFGKLFPDANDSRVAEGLLRNICCPSGWEARVQLAVLKICGNDLERIREFIDERHEYRDVVSMAEYPLQSRHFSHRKTNPVRYHEFVRLDLENHDAWLKEMSS